MTSQHDETAWSTPSTEEADPEDGLPGVARLRLMVLAALLAAQISAIMAVPMPSERLAASLAAVIVLGALQARHVRGTAPGPPWLLLGVLVAEGVATYVPLLAVGAAWPGMGGFLAASVLLVVSGRTAWVLFAAVIVSFFVATMTLGFAARDADNITVPSLAVGLTMFGVSRLASVVRQAQGMQTEVAQLAVIRERLRFARDLHDLLGYSLAAITLRAELTRRLMSSDPATAREELREVVDIARQAVAEVRQAADGYRNLSLLQEVAAAASLLASANVAARVDMNGGVVPEKIDSVLATVLRELVTNVLRHSRARNCWIATQRSGEHITLSVANDGVSPAAATHRDGGGLENLTSRLEAVGGTLSATVHGNGRFRVIAEIAVPTNTVAGDWQHRTGCTSS